MKDESYKSWYVVLVTIINVQIANILLEEELCMLRNAFLGVAVQDGYYS